jgi:hypothetical protein
MAHPGFAPDRVKVALGPAEFIDVETMDVHFVPSLPGEGG